MAIDRIQDPTVIAGYLSDASNLHGHATDLVRPKSSDEIAEILAHCQHTNTPITVSAQRTSTTGGPVPFGGWILSMEKLDRLIWHDGDRARVQAGTILGVFQEEMLRAGWMFPPDPTSRHECTVGAAIACNASGAKSYKYGPTRPWIESIEVVLPTGEIREISREDPIPEEWPTPDWQPPEVKSAAGYVPTNNLLDLFIGQEGTLGIITEATVRLIQAPKEVFSLLCFFPDIESTLSFVQSLRAADPKNDRTTPSSIEFYGPKAVDLIRGRIGALSSSARFGIWCEQDTDPDRLDAQLEAWLDLLDNSGALVEESVFAQDDPGRRKLAEMRHAVPAGINEQVVANGMPKLGTDCSVPHEALAEMVEAYLSVPIEHVLFGHIGDSHLHLNMLPKSKEELELAKSIYQSLCKRAVRLGGSVSAEHGIGKIKKAHFADMVGPEVLERFRCLKTTLDPHWILGRGNLFDPKAS